MRTLPLAVLLIPGLAAAQGDPATLARIVDQGKNHSQVMRRLRELTYGVGPRVTGSPKLRKAQEWALREFRSWGLSNVHLEQWGEVPVGFQRGDHNVGRMVAPYQVDMQFTTMNWTPGTHGLVRGPAVPEPKDMAEFERDRPLYRGAWVICGGGVFMHGPDDKEDKALRQALDGAGIAGRVWGSRDERIWSHGTFKDKTYEKRPTEVDVVVRKSDHDRILRNLEWKRPVTLEFDLQNEWFKGPIPQYNVVAEIPGTEKPDEVVIVGGHLDSWNSPGSQGANDNGTGTVTAMEAARILMAAHAKPKRTIRFILWSGEEQGLLGSSAYVKAHAAELPKISAMLNDDGGTNYQSGYEGLASQKAMLEAAFAPTVAAFPDMPQRFQVIADPKKAGGSDHAPFCWAGVPGFDCLQTGTQDYGHIWHTQFDRYEEAVPKYLVQAATNHAIVSYDLACAPTLVPR